MSLLLFLTRHARKSDWGLLASLGLAVFLLWPLLHTGYFCDDIINSLIRGRLACHHQTFLQALVTDVGIWLKAGRFFPLLFLLCDGTFYALPDLLFYKSYVLLLIVSNLVLFACLLRRLTGSAVLPALSLLLVAVSFQFRIFHDPILGFYGLMQWLLLGTLLSLLALDQHLRSGNRLWLLLSVLAYLLTLLTYEITYPFLALHAVLIFAYERSWRRTARRVWPFALALAACGAVAVTIRLRGDGSLPSRYHPSLDPLAYLSTLGRHLVAALPLSYLLADPHHVFPAEVFRQHRGLFRAALGASFPVALLILARLARCTDHAEPVNYRLLIALGLLLWVLPAALIAASTGYQQEIVLGTAYLPVYIQYFGLGLLAACAGNFLFARLAAAPRAQGFAVAAMALAFAFVSAFASCANHEVTALLAQPHRDERRNVEAALQAGLLDEVPQYALLILDNETHLWNSPSAGAAFYAMHAGKLLNPVARSQLGPPPSGPAFEIKDCCLDEHCGSVLVSAVTPVPASGPNGTARLTTRQVRLYVRGGSGADGHAMTFWLTGLYAGSEGEPKRFFRQAEDLDLVRRGPEWAVYSFASDERSILIDSVEVVQARRPAELSCGAGFYPSVRHEGHGWRWCGNSGVMYLSNATRQPRTLRVSLNLFSMEDQTLTIEGELLKQVVSLKPGLTAFSKIVAISPGALALRFTPNGKNSGPCADATRLTFSIMDDPVVREEVGPAPESP